jgi:hypothetical protein
MRKVCLSSGAFSLGDKINGCAWLFIAQRTMDMDISSPLVITSVSQSRAMVLRVTRGGISKILRGVDIDMTHAMRKLCATFQSGICD